jgi:hypothetical protein
VQIIIDRVVIGRTWYGLIPTICEKRRGRKKREREGTVTKMPSGPKSNKMMNRHAAEARQREEERDVERRAAQAKATEDAQWAETDAKTLKRQEKLEEEEKKRQEQTEKRAEKKALLDEEERELGQSSGSKKSAKRNLQKDMAKLLQRYDKEVEKTRGKALPEDAGDSLENPNRPIENTAPHIRASGIDAALHAMETHVLNEGGDREGPAADVDRRKMGRRAKVLYDTFCEQQRPILRSENPGLRRSQINNLLWEMWQKCPQNPFVLFKEQRSAEALTEERRWLQGAKYDDDAADVPDA